MSFDVLARHYRWMERILAGRKLQRCRTAVLEKITTASNVLTVGEGNGLFLAECMRRCPNARITVLDASAGMLAAARKRIEGEGLRCENITFAHEDIIQAAFKPESYDVIVTHFFLDCFAPAQLAEVIAKLSLAATREAAWLLADFQLPAHSVARIRARLIHAVMYLFFRVVTRLPARRLTPPDELLQTHDFRLMERKTSEWGLLRSDFWQRGRRFA